MSEIMRKKNRWKRNTNKQTKKKTKTEKNKGDKNYKERLGVKSYCCVFKSGFPQLTCKASLIFKSNLELVYQLFKRKRIIQVKACYYGV